MTTNNMWNTPDLTTNGQVLIGSSSGRPSAATLTASTNVTVNNSAGSIEVQTSPISDWVIFQSDTASTDSSIEYTCRISDYQGFVLIGNNTQGSAANGLGIQLSTDGGSSYDTGNNYGIVGWECDETGNIVQLDDDPWAKLQIAGSTTAFEGTDANEVVSFVMFIYQPNAAAYTKSTCYCYYNDEDGNNILQYWMSAHRSTTAITAMRLVQTSGTIDQGEFTLYGIKTP